jgi:hypothetical protein
MNNANAGRKKQRGKKMKERNSSMGPSVLFGRENLL